MREKVTRLPAGVELSPQQRQIDQLLGQYMVRDEFYDTRYKASQSRTFERDEILKKPPHFKFISEYHAAIYDPKQGNVYEGGWSDLHFWIVRRYEVAQPGDSQNNIQRYVSADVFTLRAVRGTRVMILDTLYRLEQNDYEILERRGYTLMSPFYDWLIRNGLGENGVLKIPSAISN